MAQNEQKFEDSQDVPTVEFDVENDLSVEEYWIGLHEDHLKT